MDWIRFIEHDAPRKFRDPILVEGLPGVGNVGKLAAEALAESVKAKPWCDIYNSDFPPQVAVQDDGTVRLVRNQLSYAYGAAGGRDLVFLTGDYQPLTGQGQYVFVETVLDRLAPHGVNELYTLGGYGMAPEGGKPGVLGGATDKATVKRLKDLGVRFQEDEPGSGIIGASGLFLGLGMLRGLRGACLMGQTTGELVDPRAAAAVLDILGKVLGVKTDSTVLEEKAKQIDAITRQLHAEMARARDETDLHYIG